jgi:hypothetical protein
MSLLHASLSHGQVFDTRKAAARWYKADGKPLKLRGCLPRMLQTAMIVCTIELARPFAYFTGEFLTAKINFTNNV